MKTSGFGQMSIIAYGISFSEPRPPSALASDDAVEDGAVPGAESKGVGSLGRELCSEGPISAAAGAPGLIVCGSRAALYLKAVKRALSDRGERPTLAAVGAPRNGACGSRTRSALSLISVGRAGGGDGGGLLASRDCRP